MVCLFVWIGKSVDAQEAKQNKIETYIGVNEARDPLKDALLLLLGLSSSLSVQVFVGVNTLVVDAHK